MQTKNRVSFYLPLAVLAAGLALGALTALWAFTVTATATAEARTSKAVTGVSEAQGLRDMGRITAAPVATSVGSGTATASPNDPGRASRFEIKFQTSSVGALNPGQEIIITLEDDFQVTIPLNAALITISASAVTGGGAANQVVRPDGVTVSMVGPENDMAEIRLIVPDMDPTSPGGQGIANSATVTIVFQQGAGIKNPSEAGRYNVSVRTTSDADTFAFPAASRPVFPLRVEMSTDGDPRGATMTVVALGVEGGLTSTFWLDSDGDGQRDSFERDLCNVVATSADTATCTYTITNPPFVPGFGLNTTDTDGDGIINSCDADIDGDGIPNTNEFPALPVLSNCNLINVQDGESIANIEGVFGPRTTGFPRSPRNITQAEVDRQTFELEPFINVQPSVAGINSQVTISVFDFNPGDALIILRLAGINVTPTDFPLTIPANGQTSFPFTIPSVGPTGCVGAACIPIPTGVQRIEIFSAGGADQDFNLTIIGATLIPSHTEVIANQNLTLSGAGFTLRGTGPEVCIPESGSAVGGIFLNNVPLEISDLDSCDLVGVNGIELAPDGTFTLNVIVRQLAGTIPTALLTPGTVPLKVIDTGGSEGNLLLTIPQRELTVTPGSSGPQDPVTIVGKRFIAGNPNGSNAAVLVEYRCASGPTQAATVNPEPSGNWTQILNIPSGCAVPSTNTIKTTIFVEGVSTGVVNTTFHSLAPGLPPVDLSLTKTDAPDPVAPGALLTYNLAVTNAATGSATATGVFVTESLPSGVTFFSATPSQGSYNSGTGVWTVGTLAAAGSATMELKVTVGADVPSGTVLTNNAVVAADQPDPNLANNNAVVQTTVLLVDAAPPTCRVVDAHVDGQGRLIWRFLFEDTGSGLARVDLLRAVNANVLDFRFPEGPADPIVMTLRQADPRVGPMNPRFRLTDRQGNRVDASCRTFPDGLEPADAGAQPTDETPVED